MTPPLGYILVFIKAVAGPTSGPRGSIRYDVSVTHMDGTVAEFSGVRTSTVGPNEPDTPETVYVRAADVGSTWPGCVLDDLGYQFHIVEERDFELCEEAA